MSASSLGALSTTGYIAINNFINTRSRKNRLPTPNTPKKMNRTNLLKAVESSATANGYHFYSGDEHYIPQLATAYPALWLNPPKFQSIEGRTHGKITYAVTLHAIDANPKLSPEERTQVGTRLEEQLLDTFTSLSQADFVVTVENLTIKHQSLTRTALDDVTATATADVITFF